MAAKKPIKIEVAATVAKEIEHAAELAERSVAYIVHKALAVAKGAGAAPSGDVTPLHISTNEDDPADLVKKIETLAGKTALGAAVGGAWVATRDRFAAWLKQLESARGAENADDLDSQLAEAAVATTTLARLVALSKSEYPRVRILVAQHANVSAELLVTLAKDREPAVRDAVANNPAAPGHVR
jgi:hypothetical protein